MSEAAVPTDPTGGETSPAETAEAQQDKGNYDQRILSEPQFALDEVKRQSRLITEKSDSLKDLESIVPYVQAAGGVENLIGQVGVVTRIQQNPAFLSMTEEFLRTGLPPQSPAAAAEETNGEEQYLTETERLLQDRIQGLESRIGSLSEQSLVTETRGYQSGIDRNIEEFKREYGMVPEVWEQASKAIRDKVAASELQSKQPGVIGETARNLMKTLSDPAEGPKTLELMAFDVIKANMASIVSAREQAKVAAATATSIDAPSPVQSAGGVEPRPAPKRGRSAASVVDAALERATRAAGHTDSIW